MMKKLAIVTSHPIQYNAPWFKLLAQSSQIDLKVFYTWSQTIESVKDYKFGREIKWDIPLLDGYHYEFVNNVSSNPGTHHFLGIDNPELIEAIKQYKPDVLLIFGWNFKSHLKAMRYFKGKIPVWFRGDSTLIDEKGIVKTLPRRLVLTFIYRYIDKALYVGKANKDYFKAHGLNESRLTHVPHAIDVERFADKSNKWNYDEMVASKSKKLNLIGKKVIVFAGKFEEKKQPHLLIKSIIELNSARVDKIQLLMIGNGPLENELKSMAEGHDFISFLPFQNQTQMPVVYRMADVFCLPSKGPGETWGLAVNESFACNTPVVITDKVGCAEDLILEGINGFILKNNEVEGLKDLILRALNLNKEQLDKSCDQINSKWNYNEIVKILETEVRSIA